MHSRAGLRTHQQVKGRKRIQMAVRSLLPFKITAATETAVLTPCIYVQVISASYYCLNIR